VCLPYEFTDSLREYADRHSRLEPFTILSKCRQPVDHGVFRDVKHVSITKPPLPVYAVIAPKQHEMSTDCELSALVTAKREGIAVKDDYHLVPQKWSAEEAPVSRWPGSFAEPEQRCQKYRS